MLVSHLEHLVHPRKWKGKHKVLGVREVAPVAQHLGGTCFPNSHADDKCFYLEKREISGGAHGRKRPFIGYTSFS